MRSCSFNELWKLLGRVPNIVLATSAHEGVAPVGIIGLANRCERDSVACSFTLFATCSDSFAARLFTCRKQYDMQA